MPKPNRGGKRHATPENYVRFGRAAGDKSINYRKLSFRQSEDVSFAISQGVEPLDYINQQIEIGTRNWRGVNVEDIVEDGVSVFKADKNGLPIIENMPQAMSLASRLDRKMYKVTGKVIGTGQDGEPLIGGAKSAPAQFNKADLQDRIINTLKENFGEWSGTKDETSDGQIRWFTDWRTGEKSCVFMGYEFKKPKSKKWEEQ